MPDPRPGRVPERVANPKGQGATSEITAGGHRRVVVTGAEPIGLAAYHGGRNPLGPNVVGRYRFIDTASDRERLDDAERALKERVGSDPVYKGAFDTPKDKADAKAAEEGRQGGGTY